MRNETIRTQLVYHPSVNVYWIIDSSRRISDWRRPLNSRLRVFAEIRLNLKLDTLSHPSIQSETFNHGGSAVRWILSDVNYHANTLIFQKIRHSQSIRGDERGFEVIRCNEGSHQTRREVQSSCRIVARDCEWWRFPVNRPASDMFAEKLLQSDYVLNGWRKGCHYVREENVW